MKHKDAVMLGVSFDRRLDFIHAIFPSQRARARARVPACRPSLTFAYPVPVPEVSLPPNVPMLNDELRRWPDSQDQGKEVDAPVQERVCVSLVYTG